MEVRPGYKPTEVGVVPENWDVRTLLDLAERKKELIDDGDWVEAEFLTDRGIRLIQTGNIGEGEFTDREAKKYISQESFKKLRCKDLQVGDILICRLAEPAGRACVLRDIGEDRMITAVDVTIFRPPAAIADRHFLVSVFTTPRWYQTVAERCGGSTRTRISRGELGKISVPLPPLPEQRAIAAALGDVDALLGGLDRLIAKKRDLKRAAMQQLLTGQTRLPGFRGEWDTVALGQIASIRNAKIIASAAALDTPCVELESIGQGDGRLLNWSPAKGMSAKYAFLIGDVLFGRLRAYLKKYWLASFDGVCSTEIWPLVARDERLSSCFLHLLVQTQDFVAAAGVSYGTHMPRSDWSVLRELPVRLPPVNEQLAIAAVLSDMDAELAALEARRDKSRALKQGMMQELLTGRIRLV